MRKKILVFVAVISICLFGLFNSFDVLARPYNAYYRRIDLGANNWFRVDSDSAYTFIFGTMLEVPGIETKLDLKDVIDLYSKQGLILRKGEPSDLTQYYKVQPTSNIERVELRISITKSHLWQWCRNNNYDCDGKIPDSATIKLYMLTYFEGFYVLSEDIETGAGYNKGYNDGYYRGYEEGYYEAYDEAYNKGYNKGKNEGVMEQLDLFAYLQSLFGDQGLGRLLKLELLPGVSLGAVIMIPLAFWLVSFIMRWFK